MFLSDHLERYASLFFFFLVLYVCTENHASKPRVLIFKESYSVPKAALFDSTLIVETTSQL